MCPLHIAPLQPLAPSSEGRLAQGWCRECSGVRTQWSSPGPIHPPQALWPRQQAQPGAAPCSRPVPCPAHCLEVLPLPEGLSGILPGHASSLSLLSGHGASGAGPTLVWCPMNQCWPRALSGSRAQEVPARPLPVAPCLERAARVPRTSWQVSQSTPERPTGSSHAETLQTVTVPTTQGTSGWTC